MEGAWPRRAVGPGCLGGADGSSPACYCCGRLWRGWRGEERVSRDVAAAAVPGAWVPYLAARLPALPPTGSQGLGGVGCAWKRGIGKTAPLPLPLPLSPSRAPVRRCARTPGNLAQAAPPLRGAQAPPPRCRRCPPVSGCRASGNARSRGDRLGSTREKLLESLASPEPALGVRLKGCRGSLPRRDVTVSLLIPGHRVGVGGNNPLEECAFGSGGGDTATSLHSCCLWCG